jgi:hypothetical protein
MPIERFDIAGEKVRLRPIKAADADVSYGLFKNEAILSQTSTDGPKDIDEEKDIYRRLETEHQNSRNIYLAIEQIPSLQFIGSIAARMGFL